MHDPVVDELLRQHAHLRALLERCDAILEDVEDGLIDAEALTAAAAAMARALVDHHAYEEAHATLAADERHHAQHAALALGLDDPSVRALAAVLRDLREHMRHEDEVLGGLLTG